MVQETVEKYHTEINALAIKVYNQQLPLATLLSEIEKRKEESAGNRPLEEFFLGEISFYEGQYDRSLKHYLLATSVPNVPFYCYRATALLFLSQGNQDKALGFTQKALKIYPDDYPAIKTLETLLLSGNQPEDLAEVRNKIKVLEKEQHIEEQVSKRIDSSTESSMISGSDIFSSPKTEKLTTTSLTQRLYTTQIPDDPYKPKTSTKDDRLARRIEEFQTAREDVIRSYVEQAKENAALKKDALYYLNGYPDAQAEDQEVLYLSDSHRKATGGIYISWAGKGIVINPGRNFLDNFHAQGLTIRDIHFVIVTNDLPESSFDVQSIYDLNYQINKTANEIHLIHYYFSRKAFQNLSKTLKPHFKQEREALHHLELFVDSPDVETIPLTPQILLNYFLLSNQDVGSSLGIKLELKKDSSAVTLGYLTNTPWNPLLSSLIGKCDVLITGFGGTSPNDYNQTIYNVDSLGFHGTLSLIRDTSPQITLCGEFNGNQGDLRLEVVQKLREETSKTILPADNGLVLDLRNFEAQCSITQDWAPISIIRAIRTGDFDNVVYVSPESFC